MKFNSQDLLLFKITNTIYKLIILDFLLFKLTLTPYIGIISIYFKIYGV